MPDFKYEQFYRSILGDERDTTLTRENAQKFFDKNYGFLNEDQAAALCSLMQKVDNKEGGLAFLNVSGETRKTFLLIVLASRVWIQDGKVSATATSRIAATLLYEGQTGHSMFKLLVRNIHSKSFRNISAES